MVRIPSKLTKSQSKAKNKQLVLPNTAAGKREMENWAVVTRLKLQGGQHLGKLMSIAELLFKERGELTREEISALKVSADIHKVILGKILPDLKSVEQTLNIEGEIKHTHDLENMSESQLLRVIAQEEKKELIEAEFTEVKNDDD